MDTKAYLLTYLSCAKFPQLSDLPTVERSCREDYLAWDDTLLFATDLKLTSDFSLRHRLSPFLPQRRSFDYHVSLMQEFSQRFGTFQNPECHSPVCLGLARVHGTLVADPVQFFGDPFCINMTAQQALI